MPNSFLAGYRKVIMQNILNIIMFRRRFRGRSKRKIKLNSVMHLPSTMSNNVNGNTSVILFASITSNYQVIGTALTNDTFENADRLQNVQLGANIDSIIYNIAIREIQNDGIVEYVIFKIERSDEVPDVTNTKMPTDVEITTEGLQSAFRRYQPGRVLKYGAFGVASAQPRAISVKGNYKKFNFSKVRAGDYYGILVFSRNASALVVDVQARYNAYQ